MDTNLQNKIKQYIGNLSYFDAKENMYSNKNDYPMVVNASENRQRNDSTEEALGRSGIVGVAWEIGGARGGSCYGDEAEPYTVQEPNIREIYLLDDILSELFPDLKYMQYRKIMQMTPVHHKTTGDYEYYGNRTEYYVKYIKVDELVAAFEQLGLTVDEEKLDTLNKIYEDKKTPKIKPKR